MKSCYGYFKKVDLKTCLVKIQLWNMRAPSPSLPVMQFSKCFIRSLPIFSKFQKLRWKQQKITCKNDWKFAPRNGLGANHVKLWAALCGRFFSVNYIYYLLTSVNAKESVISKYHYNFPFSCMVWLMRITCQIFR